MPNLNECLDKLGITNELLKSATKGIEMVRNAAMSFEGNTKGKYEEIETEEVLKEDAVKENSAEKEIQREKITKKNNDEDTINVDFNQINLAQAFIYSEIFGKPKSLRRGR